MERVTIAVNKRHYVEAAKQLAASAFRVGWEMTLITNLDVNDWEGKVIGVDTADPYAVKLALPDLIQGDALYIDADCVINWKGGDISQVERIAPLGAYTTPRTTLQVDWARYGVHHVPAYFHSCVMRFDPTCKGLFAHAFDIWQDLHGYASDEVALMLACARIGVRPNHIPLYMGKVTPKAERKTAPILAFAGRMESEDRREYVALAR